MSIRGPLAGFRENWVPHSGGAFKNCKFCRPRAPSVRCPFAGYNDSARNFSRRQDAFDAPENLVLQRHWLPADCGSSPRRKSTKSLHTSLKAGTWLRTFTLLDNQWNQNISAIIAKKNSSWPSNVWLYRRLNKGLQPIQADMAARTSDAVVFGISIDSPAAIMPCAKNCSHLPPLSDMNRKVLKNTVF